MSTVLEIYNIRDIRDIIYIRDITNKRYNITLQLKGLHSTTNLSSNEGGIRRSQGSVEGGVTVHVLGGVLQHALSHVVVLYRVDWAGLEPSPSQRHHYWVLSLQYLRVPPGVELFSIGTAGIEIYSFGNASLK